MKARVLSRKVWELLMLLPTNRDMLDGFRTVTEGDGSAGAEPGVPGEGRGTR